MSNKNFADVRPHGVLESIIDDVWYLTGSVVMKPLLRLPRNMVVLRHEGELTVINSVRLDKAGEAALDALGKVTHVMKIGMHGMDDAYYVDRYGAKYWSLADDKSDLAEQAERLTEETELPFPQGKVFIFKDTIKAEVALLLDREGGLLITCDSVQHWVPKKFMSPLASAATLFMGFRKPAQIGPPWRKMQTPPGGSLRADFERLAALPFKRLIGAHGGLLEIGGTELLKASIEREL